MRSAVIPGYENYTIYENGEVHSKRRKGAKGGALKQSLANTGYFQVPLWNEGKGKNFKIHRLLGICLYPTPKINRVSTI